ncbi:MAG: hypothetical protein CVT94_03095 [Bacteroidetes bacterium HGW-Bacteroidetes-11]|jgi:gliding motility-associated-like protein|nr:MAG: hypothetical protein CVT94_03095 [Bacteroidetes bacterium HGW-Bacteroidetes-11]
MSKPLTSLKLNTFFSLLIFLLISTHVSATHQRAGEITYRHISGLTYEVTITTYTFAPSAADRCELTINWGDGQSSVLSRTNGPPGTTPAGIFCEHTGENISSEIRLSIYKGIHTYAAPSNYRLWLEDPNRNLGIQNIPNSVDVPLYIESLLVVNPFLGTNNSPILLIPPVDNGCVGLPFLHNPGAYDPDGDSLSFRLVNCKGAGGRDIPGYKLPNEVDLQNPGTFTINEVTGDVLWESPARQGEYNFAFLIEEWRNGVLIGYVTRDMQVNIIACNNTPPELFVTTDTCVVAGDTLRLRVRATDADNHKLTLTADGGPLLLPISPAIFNQPGDSTGQVSETLVWATVCAHVRKQPYQIFFKVIDNGVPVRLFDLQTTNITVIAPPVKDPNVTPLGNNMVLNWTRHNCNEAIGYRIYRRAGSSGFIPSVCQTGVPPESGYQLIAETTGITTTSFIDDNKGAGLVRGITYCYIVTAWFEDGSESIASEEFCANLKKDMPVFTNVSINSTSATTGSIEVIWSKPTELDPVQTPGPYIYRLFRSQGFNNVVRENIAEFINLNDTIFTDNGLNTKDTAWTYTIEFINNTPDNTFTIGFTPPASSVFICTTPSDRQITLRMVSNVPWSNLGYTIYRKNEAGTFDSIAFANTATYTDTGLINEQEYCYLVRSTGTYGTPGYKEPLLNFSQEKCASPRDNVPPCPPNLLVEVECDLNELRFRWEDISISCAPDIERYYLYRVGNPHILIESFNSSTLSYIYSPPQTIAGCFFVVGSDANGNIDTANYKQVCTSIDDCPRYRLPNVFTPNSDGYNDLFVPFPGYTSVDRIDLKIHNRWGVVVFETKDPAIRWDGRDKNTNKPCADGVYFYVCDVYEVSGNPELEGDKVLIKRTITDSLHILR